MVVVAVVAAVVVGANAVIITMLCMIPALEDKGASHAFDVAAWCAEEQKVAVLEDIGSRLAP